MVKSGARVSALRSIMRLLGHVEAAAKPPAPRLGLMPTPAIGYAMDLYRALGGVQGTPKLAPGSWDVAYEGGLLLELDEDMHFNRYRALTLNEPWAAELPWAEAFRNYAVKGERRAGTGGSRWTTPSAERMFGQADPDGTFGEHGAPRWKQRALYDAMKDAMASTGQVALARVSIYDRVGGHSLNEVLYGRATVDAAEIDDLVLRRTA